MYELGISHDLCGDLDILVHNSIQIHYRLNENFDTIFKEIEYYYELTLTFKAL